jgi:hypothetical protein
MLDARYWILDTRYWISWIGWIGWIKLDKLDNKQQTYPSIYLRVNSFSSFSAVKVFSHECTNFSNPHSGDTKCFTQGSKGGDWFF